MVLFGFSSATCVLIIYFTSNANISLAKDETKTSEQNIKFLAAANLFLCFIFLIKLTASFSIYCYQILSFSQSLFPPQK
jgi:hypothetical protein